MTITRRRALWAGLLYLLTHVTSVAAVAAYGDALGTASLMPGGGPDAALRAGALLETVLALACAGTGFLLLPILRAHGPAAAHAFLGLRVVEAAVIAAGVLPALALLSARQDPAFLTDPAAPIVAEALGGLHAASFLVGQGLVISVNTLVIATLLTRSRLVPRVIGVLGLIGGTAVLTGNVGQLLGVLPPAGVVAGVLAVPVFLFEISFAMHLVFRGVRDVSHPAPRRRPAPQPLRPAAS